MRVSTLRGQTPRPLALAPEGFRRQEPSDVWSIHHLYHRLTPRPVQFAEALTSDEWELPRKHIWERLPFRGGEPSAFVLESVRGLEGYCQVDAARGVARIDMLIEPTLSDQLVPFLAAAASEAGIGEERDARIDVPDFFSEQATLLEAAGLWLEDERVALVRHTTVAARVHPRLMPLPTLELGERAPRGVPSYLWRRSTGPVVHDLPRTEQAPH
jgi:hypothetical protein